jgi:hypothetical protein
VVACVCVFWGTKERADGDLFRLTEEVARCRNGRVESRKFGYIASGQVRILAVCVSGALPELCNGISALLDLS